MSVYLDRERALSNLASAQRGVVSRNQLEQLGYSEGDIARRKTKFWFHDVGPAVYAVGHTGLSRRARGIAALLQTGEDAGLSYESAARIWQMTSPATDGPIHVSVPHRRRLVEPPGVKIHRPRNLKPGDIVWYRGLWVTTPERTIIDLMPKATEVELTRMLEQMVTVLGRNPDHLHAWGHALPKLKGRAKLWRALDWIAGPAVVRSQFEELFRSVCQDAGLPSPLTNYKIAGKETDAVWLELMVAVELDSWRWHGGRWQFHQDRRKGLAINKAGFELVRLTWWQLKHEPADVITALECALERGRQRLAARTG